MARTMLTTQEAIEIRGQMTAARIAGDYKLADLCQRALGGLDSRACWEAKDLCKYIWANSLPK